MQIGPRIRVGGSVGKFAQKHKKALLIGGALALTGGLGGFGALATGAAKLGSAASTGGKLGLLKKAGGFLSAHKKDIVDYGTLGEGVYDRMQENKAAGEMQNRYRALQPLRDQALAQLQAPTPDVHSLFQEPTAQPTRYRRIGSTGGY